MSEQPSENATRAMSRGGFLANLGLLAAALGTGLAELPPLFRPGSNVPRPSADPGPAGRPCIHPPLGSVKRRG